MVLFPLLPLRHLFLSPFLHHPEGNGSDVLMRPMLFPKLVMEDPGSGPEEQNSIIN